LRTHTEEAIIFKPEQNITEELAWYHRCLCPQRRKKSSANALVSNLPPKRHARCGATAIRATQVPSFSLKRIWSHLISITFGE